MKNNKTLSINRGQKVMSQARFNTRIDPKKCAEVELMLYIQELSTLMVQEFENMEDEKDIIMEVVHKKSDKNG